MTFSVIWRKQAREFVEGLWDRAANPNAVAAASDRINELLTRDPLNQGESRSGDYRLMFEGPLAAYFRVNAAGRRVIVLSVGPSNPSP
ncbi:MAG TPA: hypothetical protein VGF55_08090 [Gemmataceae bacterium]|jgi:plasmid stabilization system protein ParE